ncbi:MAG: DNA-3-methyladenine glycosylase family protein [Candidatus Limnocylindrales bacterium]
MPSRTIVLTRPLDLRRTLAPLTHGPYDPTIRLTPTTMWRASRTPAGPSVLWLRLVGRTVTVECWGPGADWELAHVPDLIGETDAPEALEPRHPLVADLVRRLPGVRLTRSNRVVEALVPAVVEQKITGVEAQRVYARLVRTHGEPAPPGSETTAPLTAPGRVLRLAPAPRTLASLPYEAYHPLGLERRRADVLRRIGILAPKLEAVVTMPAEAGRARLLAVNGIGPWTAAEAMRIACGDPDAVSLGDYHLPRLVAYSLAGERTADDARMLELLDPYRGQRARVIRLLELGGRMPERRGPHIAARAIERI